MEHSAKTIVSVVGRENRYDVSYKDVIMKLDKRFIFPQYERTFSRTLTSIRNNRESWFRRPLTRRCYEPATFKLAIGSLCSPAGRPLNCLRIEVHTYRTAKDGWRMPIR